MTAAERNAKNVAATASIKVGDTVRTIYGTTEVVKLNAKSIVVKTLNGGTVTVARHLIISHWPKA